MKPISALAIMCAFSFGYIVNDAFSDLGHDLVSSAKADVAGMGYRDLSNDRDFVWAVQEIVSDCSFDVSVDIQVDVDGDYGYGTGSGTADASC